MTRAQALTVARRFFGKHAAVRENGRPSSPEQRADALQRAKAAGERLESIGKELQERLAALPWYVALIQERKQTAKARSEAQAWIYYHRCIMGEDTGIAFWVRAVGDTWADAVRDAEAKRSTGETGPGGTKK